MTPLTETILIYIRGVQPLSLSSLIADMHYHQARRLSDGKPSWPELVGIVNLGGAVRAAVMELRSQGKVTGGDEEIEVVAESLWPVQAGMQRGLWV